MSWRAAGLSPSTPSSPIPTIESQRGAALGRGSRSSTRGMPRLLILGGTSEARELGERLAGRADLAVTVSLAGRTARPAAQAVALRVGGFGGAAGLAAYLRAQRIDALLDATHPF